MEIKKLSHGPISRTLFNDIVSAWTRHGSGGCVTECSPREKVALPRSTLSRFHLSSRRTMDHCRRQSALREGILLHAFVPSRRHLLTSAAAALATPFLARLASAQPAWPTRPVRVIIPYPPAGGAD